MIRIDFTDLDMGLVNLDALHEIIEHHPWKGEEDCCHRH
jgi:hypothetical protein